MAKSAGNKGCKVVISLGKYGDVLRYLQRQFTTGPALAVGRI